LGFGTTVHAGWTNGYIITISDVFFVCFCIQTWLVIGIRPLGGNSVVRSLIVFAAAGVLSMLNSESKLWTQMQVVLIIQVLLVNYVLMAQCLKDQDDLDTALLGISLSLILQGLVACVQFGLQRNFLFFSSGYSSGETIMVGDDDGTALIRVFGTVGKPNGLAMLLAPLFLLNIALLSIKDMPGRRLRMLSVALGSLGLVFSGSRGAWLSCSVALLGYYVFLLWRFRDRRWQLLGGAILFMAFVSILGGDYIRKRVSSDDKNAAGSRIDIIGIAVEMIKAHPIVGVGANNYSNVMRRYLPKDFETRYVGQVHNTYLLVAAEMGLVGFAAAFLLMRSMLVEALSSSCNSESRLQTALGLGLILVLVQVSVHSLFEAYIGKMAIASILSLTGMVAAVRRFNV
jgi:O-antigen ligase